MSQSGLCRFPGAQAVGGHAGNVSRLCQDRGSRLMKWTVSRPGFYPTAQDSSTRASNASRWLVHPVGLTRQDRMGLYSAA